MGSWAELAPLKSVKASHKAKGKDNEFTLLFGEVEVHNEYDLATFMDAEIDFEHIFKKLNLHKKQFESTKPFVFRTRKIKGNTLGRYYPSHCTLIVDLKHMDSFIHELGHLLDYEWLPRTAVTRTYNSQGGATKTKLQRNMLSDQDNFKPIIEGYTKHYNETARSKAGSKYWLCPKEILARTFELYIVRRFGDNTLGEKLASYSRSYRTNIYPVDNTELMAKVDEYFNALFNTAE